MKIFKVGLFKTQWMCWCCNKSNQKGFYPCNADGNYQRDLLGRGQYYACAKCGRIIDPQTLRVVGLTRGFKVRGREVRDLLLALREDGVEPVGIGFRGMYWSLPPALARSIERFRPQLRVV